MTAGCANLPEIALPSCGNSVIDPGEDCDGFPDKASGATCAKPGAPNACHYLAGANGCPAGFGKGTDGVCHEASGTFDATFASPTIAGSTDPQVGDFDGDGKPDIMFDAVDHVDITYFEGSIPRGTIPIAKTRGRRAVAANFIPATKTDAATDILLPVGLEERNEPLVALAGSTGPTLTPIPYSTEDPGVPFRVVPISAYYQFPNNGDLDLPGILLDCENAPPLTTLCTKAPGKKLALEIQDTAAGMIPFDDVGGEIWPAALPKPDLSTLVLGGRANVGGPVDDLVLAFSGQTILRQISVKPVGAPLPVSLPIPQVDMLGCTGVHTVETAFNAPKAGLARIYVSASCTETGASVVFELDADGMGGFLPAVADGVIKDPGAKGSACSTSPPLLLGIGDMNGDGVDDFVFSYGVVVTPSPAPPSPIGSAIGSNDFAVEACEWAQASVGDLNHDGFADVVALSPGDSGLDVVLGGPFSLLATGRLNAFGPITGFALGDYDGDGIPDVAVAEASTATQISAAGSMGCPDADVVMFWSRPNRIPEDATTIGSLPQIQQVVSARIVADATTGAMGNGVADLGIISGGCPAVHSGAVFIGSTDRVLLAPIHIIAGQAIMAFQSTGDVAALAIGDFTTPMTGPATPPFKPDGIDDIGALLASGPNLFAYLLPVNADGSVATSSQNLLLQIANDDDFGLKHAKVDEPSLPSIAILPSAASPTGGATAVAVIAYKQTTPAGTIRLVTISSTDGKANGTLAPLTLADTNIQPRLNIVSADYDGDGIPDVAIEVAQVDGSNEKGALVLSLADGNGGFGPMCEVKSADATPVLGITTIDTESAHPIVAIASMRSIFLYEKGENPCTAKPDVVIPITNASATDGLTSSDDVLGVAAADMTGDGLADLLVVRRTKLEIRPQLAAFVGGDVK